MSNYQCMVVICIGVLSFIILFLYDIATLKRVKGRIVLAASGYLINIYAIAAAAMVKDDPVIYSWTVWAGWCLAVMGLWWLLYCLVLFPPIMRTYTEVKGPALTTEEPYALSRHPGVYGYTFLILGLIMIFNSTLLLMGGIIWIVCNIAYVIIQDQWIFPRLFLGYREYKETTPMIFPSVESAKRFIEYYRN